MRPEISICICTLHHTDGIASLLRSLRSLDSATPSREVIVIDNDAERSAEPIVRQANADGLEILYDVEPIQNIALARTRSLRYSRGEWIAFIDDDEEADPRWLLELWTFAHASRVDGVFGFVSRRFETAIPEWIRAAYPVQERITGGLLRWWQTATGNALVRRSAMFALGELFNPAYGLTGGEDTDIFYRMEKRGAVFVALRSAVVYESITAEKARVAYLLRWFWSSGAITARVDFADKSLWRLKKWFCVTTLLFLYFGLTGICCFPFSRTNGLRKLCRASLEGGVLFGKLTGKLIQRYTVRGSGHDPKKNWKDSAQGD
jgi:succinoglycan biosynthesis protein ExoM